MINWKVRIKNPIWWAQVILGISTPVLAYAGLNASELDTWEEVLALLIEVFTNPYMLSLAVVSAWNAVNDPTTSGLADSAQALEYEWPKKE